MRKSARGAAGKAWPPPCASVRICCEALMSSWFFGSLLIGLILGVLLSFLLPLAGATRLREPFAWMLWIPAAVILLILLFQYLATLEPGLAVPVLRLLVVTRESAGYWIVAVEAAFAAYMLSFSIRTGKGI